MVIYTDKIIEDSLLQSVLLILVGILGALFAEYYIFLGLIQLKSYNWFFFVGCLTFCFFLTSQLSAIFHWIEGRDIVFNITLLYDSINIENSLKRKVVIKATEIVNIKEGQKKWRFFVPKVFRGLKGGLTINLKDGRFFRVSPHMERIDELKGELERIIEENKSE